MDEKLISEGSTLTSVFLIFSKEEQGNVRKGFKFKFNLITENVIV